MYMSFIIDNVNVEGNLSASTVTASTVTATTITVIDNIYSGNTNFTNIFLNINSISGFQKITVGSTEPQSPSNGDLWVDTN